MDDVAPPLKRRRTSEDDSYASRPESRDATLPFRGDDNHKRVGDTNRPSRSRHRSGERSENEEGYHDEDRHDSTYLRRTQSSEYSPRPRDQRSISRSRSRSGLRSLSQSRSRSRSRTRLRTRTDSRSRSRSGSRSRSTSFHSTHTLPQTDEPPNKNTLSFKSLHTIRRAHARGITCVKFSPDASLLAAASADTTISIYTVHPPDSATPLKLLRVLRAHLAGVNALAWSPIGPNYALASASDDKSILLWSPLSSDFPIRPSPLLGHSNYVFSLAFSPKGNMLVSGSYDEAVFLWDVRSATVMRSLPAHSDPVSGVDFLRDGSMVCSCASDGLIRIWDAGTGQCLKTLVDEDRKPVTSVRFSPNGKFVLGWGLDGCIRLWKYIEGKCVKTYMGHTNEEYSLGGTIGDYDNGSRAFVVSGSEDGDIVIWDVTTKEVLWRGKGHRDVVLSVDFARDNNTGRGMLASVGKDRDLRLWMEEGDASQFRATGQVNGTLKFEDSMDIDMMEAATAETEMDTNTYPGTNADGNGDVHANGNASMGVGVAHDNAIGADLDTVDVKME